MQWINRFEFEKYWWARWILPWEEKFKLRKLGLFFLFSLLLSYLIHYDFDVPYFLTKGEVAQTNIKSPVSFEIVDEEATQNKKLEAAQSIPPVLDFDPQVYDQVTTKIFRAFEEMRQRLPGTSWSKNSSRRRAQVKRFKENKTEFEKLIEAKVSEAHFQWMAEKRFNPEVENWVVELVESWLLTRVADSLDKVLKENDKRVLVRVVENEGEGREFTVARENILDLSGTKAFPITPIENDKQLGRRERRLLRKFSQSLLTPNLTFNRNETRQRRQKAEEAVLPIVMVVKKGQTIINQGAVAQPIHLKILDKIKQLKASRSTDLVSLFTALMLVMLVMVFFSYLQRYTKKIVVEQRDLMVMASVTIGVTVMVKVFWFVTNAAFTSKLGAMVPSSFFLYAAPTAVGSMLIGMLLNSAAIVWLFTFFLSSALSLMVEDKFSFFLVTMAAGMTAARSVYDCKRRNDIYYAGLRTGLVAAGMIGFLWIVNTHTGTSSAEGNGWLLLAGFVSGLMSAGIAMMFVPLLESIFNYTTNVKLLELSNLNHPLMKEMIVKAPGTYHHSLVVGHMCESAAEAIGANPLLAKVMAYYHDIGKTEHAGYFIENQKPGHNPHDRLSPHMSKTILVAHVKDGAELGMHHKLGRPIIDGILQHHGTTLISYFYNKALEEQDEDIDQVLEDDFRYPGPKPQFKEAGLCMLADSIEAAARSLDEPTTARLQNIVRNIIQRKFMEGQLDECDLTLRDLSTIEEAFERIILGIYHQRIDYPKEAGGGTSEEAPISFAKAKGKDKQA